MPFMPFLLLYHELFQYVVFLGSINGFQKVRWWRKAP